MGSAEQTGQSDINSAHITGKPLPPACLFERCMFSAYLASRQDLQRGSRNVGRRRFVASGVIGIILKPNRRETGTPGMPLAEASVHFASSRPGASDQSRLIQLIKKTPADNEQKAADIRKGIGGHTMSTLTSDNSHLSRPTPRSEIADLQAGFTPSSAINCNPPTPTSSRANNRKSVTSGNLGQAELTADGTVRHEASRPAVERYIEAGMSPNTRRAYADDLSTLCSLGREHSRIA